VRTACAVPNRRRLGEHEEEPAGATLNQPGRATIAGFCRGQATAFFPSPRPSPPRGRGRQGQALLGGIAFISATYSAADNPNPMNHAYT